MNISPISFVSPLHDPEGKFISDIRTHGEKLCKLYGGNAAVSVTSPTSREVKEILKLQGFRVESLASNSQHPLSENYCQAISMGLALNTPYIHLIDFDRALHWIQRFPEELRDVKDHIPKYKGFVSFVRSQRAFETHAFVERSTEATINAIASELAHKAVDIMSGSFAFEKSLAAIVVKKSQKKDFGIYAEFLKIALMHKYLIHTIEVEGLEWETPDQHKKQLLVWGMKHGYKNLNLFLSGKNV